MYPDSWHVVGSKTLRFWRLTPLTCVKNNSSTRQREGQTVIVFREELLSLIEEADGDNIRVNDLICMMMQIGVSDPALQRELGSVKNPTLLAFNDKIEGFEQARKTVSSFAFGLAAKGTQKHNQNPPSSKNAQRMGQSRGNGERSRRLALSCKCFRCARDDHMLPQCTYSASVKCNTCNGTGHISLACGKRQSANAANTQIPAASSSSLVPSYQLAIGYDGPAHSSLPANIPHADGSSCNWGSQSVSSRVLSNERTLGLRYDTRLTFIQYQRESKARLE